MSQVALQAGAYPGFQSMKQLGIFLLSPGWDASPSSIQQYQDLNSTKGNRRWQYTRGEKTNAIEV